MVSALALMVLIGSVTSVIISIPPEELDLAI